MSWAVGLGRGPAKRPLTIVAFSGFIPTVDGLEIDVSDLDGYPVAIAHGTLDQVIPAQWGRAARDLLAEAGADVTYHESPLPHTIDPTILPAVRDLIAARPRSQVTKCYLDKLGAMFSEGLAELHTHLGGSVASEILWSLAHEQGIALPVKDYWEFDALVTVSDPRGVANLDALDRIYHWTELIQSSPLAVERSVHAAIGGAYRSQRITTLELRFNPMKRNRGGERDLDHIILAAVRGLDVARLEYPQVRCGLILMMDRTFAPRQNEIVVEKAIRWASRGVVGIDIAGPRPGGGRYDYTQVKPMVETARAAGLGITIHVGEEGATGAEELGEVIEHLRPERIGHGILAAQDPELMRLLRDAGTVLEICPTSNLLTKALADEDAVRETFRTFVEHGVAFTIATDGPEMMHTHLRDELELLERIGALTRRGARSREPPRPRGELHSPASGIPSSAGALG